MIIKSLLALALTASATSAFAVARISEINLVEGQSVLLSDCKGQASVNRVDGTLKLFISAASCSNIMMGNKEIGKLRNGRGTEEIGFNERVGQNNFQVVAQSDSKKTGVIINVSSVRYPVRHKPVFDVYTPADFSLSTGLFGRRSGSLEECRGSVSLSMSGTSVYLNFSNVEKCSNFDVLSENGRPVLAPNTKISLGNSSVFIADMNRSPGASIKVIVKSDSGAHFDVFKVNLLNWF